MICEKCGEDFSKFSWKAVIEINRRLYCEHTRFMKCESCYEKIRKALTIYTDGRFRTDDIRRVFEDPRWVCWHQD